jgi:hypothetical protein
MKTLLHYYRKSPALALIISCIGFFVWATTMIIIMVVLAVAFAQ